MQFLIKTAISALVIAAVSTVSRRVPVVGAIMISLPLNSMLAFVWLYNDSKDVGKVIDFSYSIFWIIVPSVVFFLILPALLKRDYGFYAAMALSSLAMAASYWLYVKLLTRLGVRI